MDPTSGQELVEQAGLRIDRLLDQLGSTLDERAFEAVEELLRAVTEFYGAGLGRIVDLVSVSPALVTELAGDELVASLLTIHGFHPDGFEERVEAGLAAVRPFLAQHDGDVELIAVDPELGAVKIRLLGSCDGCPSSAVTLHDAVERAIRDAAPEVSAIVVDDAVAPPVRAGVDTLVTLTRKPVFETCPSDVSALATTLSGMP